MFILSRIVESPVCLRVIVSVRNATAVLSNWSDLHKSENRGAANAKVSQSARKEQEGEHTLAMGRVNNLSPAASHQSAMTPRMSGLVVVVDGVVLCAHWMDGRVDGW